MKDLRVLKDLTIHDLLPIRENTGFFGRKKEDPFGPLGFEWAHHRLFRIKRSRFTKEQNLSGARRAAGRAPRAPRGALRHGGSPLGPRVAALALIETTLWLSYGGFCAMDELHRG